MAKKYSKDHLKITGRIIWMVVGLMIITTLSFVIMILLNVYDYFP